METKINIRTSSSEPLIFLPTIVNGKGPFEFVLDTGAGMTILTEELARTLGIEKIEVKEAMGAPGRKLEVALGTVDTLSVGDARIYKIKVGIMKDLPRCTRHGAIGYNFLKNFAVTIDYKNNTPLLALPADRSHADYSDGGVLRLKLASPGKPIILVDAVVNDQSTHQFVLDTGASQTVVSPQLAEELQIVHADNDRLVGVGGVNRSSTGTLKSLSVGSARLADLSVFVADVLRPLSDVIGARLDGILGYNFLSKFKVGIDYRNEILRFQE